jgi:hypothetical protein
LIGDNLAQVARRPAHHAASRLLHESILYSIRQLAKIANWSVRQLLYFQFVAFGRGLAYLIASKNAP